MRQDADLFAEQCIGPLQFLVAHQQPFNAFGDLVDLGLIRHGNVDCMVCRMGRRRILFVGARGVVHMPQFNGKQEEVKAIRSGSTLGRRRCDF